MSTPIEVEHDRYPMIGRVSNSRIFTVEIDLKDIWLVEQCDQHFAVQMTPADLRRLAEELNLIADRVDAG